MRDNDNEMARELRAWRPSHRASRDGTFVHMKRVGAGAPPTVVSTNEPPRTP